MSSRFLIIFLTVFIDLLGFGIIIPILPNYAIQLGANTFLTGVIAGVFSLMNFFMTSYLGSWSDKVGRRPVLLVTILMNALSYLLLGFSKNLFLVLLSRVVAGVGSANISVAQAYIADITLPQERTRRMGLIGMAFGLGFVLGPPIGGYLKHLNEQNGMLYVGLFTSALCFINLISAYFFLDESHLQKDKNKHITFTPIYSIRQFFEFPVIRSYLIYGFIFIAAFSIFQVLSTVHWQQHCLLKDKQIGWMFGFVGIMSIFWQGFGLKWILRVLREQQIIVVVSVLMSIALLGMMFLDAENVLSLSFVLLFFISMGNGLISPSVTSLLSQQVSSQQTGSLLGVFQSLNSLARAIAPALGGYLYDVHYSYPFILAFVLMLFSVGLVRRKL
ncbi:MAG: tetracycline resistance MFS efflux pump [Bacteroidia bacterium]|nr:MAG: tetracycline resistance MFS efflux pump [Bacteroidia bacterium]